MSQEEVVIVAGGGANIASLQYALERLGVPSLASADAVRIRAASHVILPGVGAAGHAMQQLRRDGLDALIRDLRQPVLGICLGMQLLYESSAEGPTQCLGLIPGCARRFVPAAGRPVPHMGWNSLEIAGESPLLAGIGTGDYAYFVHSYSLPVAAATLATATYGEAFSACVAWRNFYGTQFHPERSAALGARVLRNFVTLCN
ncbi:MAG: imidazole glycerol phosphate synthase subunit HisH [Steroidobacterales bacterium]